MRHFVAFSVPVVGLASSQGFLSKFLWKWPWTVEPTFKDSNAEWALMRFLQIQWKLCFAVFYFLIIRSQPIFHMPWQHSCRIMYKKIYSIRISMRTNWNSHQIYKFRTLSVKWFPRWMPPVKVQVVGHYVCREAFRLLDDLVMIRLMHQSGCGELSSLCNSGRHNGIHTGGKCSEL